MTGLSWPTFPFRGVFIILSWSSKYESSWFTICSKASKRFEVLMVLLYGKPWSVLVQKESMAFRVFLGFSQEFSLYLFPSSGFVPFWLFGSLFIDGVGGLFSDSSERFSPISDTRVFSGVCWVVFIFSWLSWFSRLFSCSLFWSVLISRFDFSSSLFVFPFLVLGLCLYFLGCLGFLGCFLALCSGRC